MGLLPLVLKFPDWMNELDQSFSTENKSDKISKPHLNKYKHEFSNWQSSLQNNGLQLSIDVKNFAPSELIVRTTENTITVEGKHGKKKQDHKCICRQFIRQYTLPKGINGNDLITTLSSDGVLIIKTPPRIQCAKSKTR